MSRTELQGFLSVKIPPKMRGFLPWKTWKRQWLSIKCLPSGGIDLVVGRNSQNILHVSSSDIIVRTQSRSHLYAFGVYPREGTTANFCLAGTTETDSQKWISTLRKLLRPPLLPVEEGEFFVSVIDNSFTRSSGFPGVYGILRVNNTGITITDPFTSKIVANWPWRQLSHLYLASTANKEDRGRVCTIITSSKFPTGMGKIRLFCEEALDLLRTLTRGKCTNFVKLHIPKTAHYRHHTFSCDTTDKDPVNNPAPWVQPRRKTSCSDSVRLGRRISKSEGNLLSLLDQLDNSSECSDSGFIHDFYNSVFSACFADQDEKNKDDDEDGQVFRKIGPGIVSTGVDVIAISEMKTADSHVYQEVGREMDHDEPDYEAYRESRMFSPRRQSGVSIASGVYEEIDELAGSFMCSLNTVEEDEQDSPPPLPPRRSSFCKRSRSNTYQNMSTLQLPSFSGMYMSKSAGSTPMPSPPSLSRATSSAEFFAGSWQREEESHYLPMNSCTRFLGSVAAKEEEQQYVVMSSFIKDHT